MWIFSARTPGHLTQTSSPSQTSNIPQRARAVSLEIAIAAPKAKQSSAIFLINSLHPAEAQITNAARGGRALQVNFRVRSRTFTPFHALTPGSDYQGSRANGGAQQSWRRNRPSCTRASQNEETPTGGRGFSNARLVHP